MHGLPNHKPSECPIKTHYSVGPALIVQVGGENHPIDVSRLYYLNDKAARTWTSKYV